MSLESLEDRKLLSVSFGPAVSFPVGLGPESLVTVGERLGPCSLSWSVLPRATSWLHRSDRPQVERRKKKPSKLGEAYELVPVCRKPDGRGEPSSLG